MQKYTESETLLLKEKYTELLGREIVSFLNASGGTVIIGIRDDGTAVGVSDIDGTLKKLSDLITSGIEPNPQDEIRSELKFDEGKTLIFLYVNKGSQSLYCQKKYGYSSTGCTVRIGTTCRQMTAEQIRIRYEQNFSDTEYMLKKKASMSDLSFRQLKIYYSEKGYHLEDHSFETNLNFRNDRGEYNLLAELLADRNNIPFIFAKFNGTDKSSISERSDYGYGCLLTSYAKLKDRLSAENICVSNTSIRPRNDQYLYDEDCVNEAVLNALVHNDWTISEPQVSMFGDRIEILSHGGLPGGLTKSELFEGISRPRNAALMRVFLSMGLVEHTGHGVPRIIRKYGKEVFHISDHTIKCVIPFDPDICGPLKKAVTVNCVNVSRTEKCVIDCILLQPDITAHRIALKIGMTERTIERSLASLQKKGILERIGSRKTGNWQIIKLSRNNINYPD